MFIDLHCAQEKKYGQEAFGDYFASRKFFEEGRLIAVLSDGLGSGIKANILSCMTATMLLRFVEEAVPIKKAAEIIMNSLPVCKVRGLSYATLSAVECDDEGQVRIVEEGNPGFIWLWGLEERSSGRRAVLSPAFPDRKLETSRFQAESGDRLIICTDGVTQAGLGRPGPQHGGLGREGLLEILRRRIKMDPNIPSRDLARHIVEEAVAVNPGRRPQDDLSACVIHFRPPRRALVFTGAPYERDKDFYYARIFERFEGRKAICGGTTAKLIARELGRSLQVAGDSARPGLPPLAHMEGADLVTEGLLTLTRALEYLERGQSRAEDPAGALVRFLLQSDALHFMVGAGLNQAHYDPALPVEYELRSNIVKKIAEILKDKYLKNVTRQKI